MGVVYAAHDRALGRRIALKLVNDQILPARLVARLMEPDLLAQAGIRTKSTGAARFRAGS